MGFLSDIFGGGGSSSSSKTVNQTTLNTTTTTIFETDELAKAMQSQADATLKSSQMELIKEKAKLNQNALFFNEIEGGLKKWAFLVVFAYGGYRIIKKGKLL